MHIQLIVRIITHQGNRWSDGHFLPFSSVLFSPSLLTPVHPAENLRAPAQCIFLHGSSFSPIPINVLSPPNVPHITPPSPFVEMPRESHGEQKEEWFPVTSTIGRSIFLSVPPPSNNSQVDFPFLPSYNKGLQIDFPFFFTASIISLTLVALVGLPSFNM